MYVALIGGILNGILEIGNNWMKKKIVKQEGEMKIAKSAADAKAHRLQTEKEGDIAWENTALLNAGIKDEVMMAVVLLPMVLCFIPGFDVHVRRGFQVMKESLPAYWEYAFYCTVGVSYGLRKWTDFMRIRRGA